MTFLCSQQHGRHNQWHLYGRRLLDRPVGRTPRRLQQKQNGNQFIRSSTITHNWIEPPTYLISLVFIYPKNKPVSVKEKTNFQRWRNESFKKFQTNKQQLTVIFVLVLDLVVEVLDDLGDLLVERVENVEIVQVEIGHVGFAFLVQLGRARHWASISSLIQKLLKYIEVGGWKKTTQKVPSEQSLSKALVHNFAAPNWLGRSCVRHIQGRCGWECCSNRRYRWLRMP